MKTFLFCISIIICNSIYGQLSWYDYINSRDTYGQIKDNIDAYFKLKGTGKGSGFKQYMRWRFSMDPRASDNKPLKNFSVLNLNGYSQALRKTSRSNLRSTNGDWENLGPFDYTVGDVFSGASLGRINCTAFHPTIPDIMWIGAANGGVWITTNGGLTWSPQTDHLSSIGITSIVVDQTNGSTIYALTGDGRNFHTPSIGVIKSTNGGATWKTTGLSFSREDFKFGYTMVSHPTDPNVLYVGMRSGNLFRTDNGGTTFSQVLSGVIIWDIEFAPGMPDRIYVSTNQGLYRSVDGGDSWFLDNDPNFPTTYAKFDIAVSPSAPLNVYVLFSGDTNVAGTFRGCYKSTDLGNSFTMMSNSPNILGAAMDGQDSGDQSPRDVAFIVDPNNDNRLFAGDICIWKSEDSGATWQRETWQTRNFAPIDPWVHADQINFYWLGNDLIVNNDGGIFKTSDYGNSWTELSGGLSITQFYELDVLNGSFIGGTQDNGTYEGDTTSTQFHGIFTGDGFGAAWAWGNTNVKFITTQSWVARREAGSNIIIWDEPNGFWFSEIEMHTTDPNYLFIDRGANDTGGCCENRLFRGHEELFIWNYIWEDLGTGNVLSNHQIEGYSQCTSNSEVMYVVNQNVIIRTDNLSSPNPTWTVLSNPEFSTTKISDVVVDPINEDRVWFTCSQYNAGRKVWQSTNGGSSWTNISGSIENIPIICIEYDPSSGGIYVGTDIGVYYRGPNMTDWISFANYLPNTRVTDIEIRGDIIYISTFGRGLWKSKTFSPCLANIVHTDANNPVSPTDPGHQIHHAGQSITTSRDLRGGIGTEIYYNAGSFIDFLPGFAAYGGNILEAKIGPCPN